MDLTLTDIVETPVSQLIGFQADYDMPKGSLTTVHSNASGFN